MSGVLYCNLPHFFQTKTLRKPEVQHFAGFHGHQAPRIRIFQLLILVVVASAIMSSFIFNEFWGFEPNFSCVYNE